MGLRHDQVAFYLFWAAAAAVERAVSIILDSTTVFTVAAAVVISSMAITPVVLAELVVVNFRQTDLHLD